MSQSYEEILRGETFIRLPPEARHEIICERLHTQIAHTLLSSTTSRLLPPRSVVQVAFGTLIRPDVALVTTASGKLWLAAEVISSQDHRFDTVTKKALYEEVNLPRLWMIDPRYDNVEVYHGSPYGLVLKHILASREILEEVILPGFRMTVHELFKTTLDV